MSRHVMISCPHCKRSGLRLRREHLGRKVTCKHCGKEFRSEADESTPASSADDVETAPRFAHGAPRGGEVTEARLLEETLRDLQARWDDSRAHLEGEAASARIEADRLRSERDAARAEAARLAGELEALRGECERAGERLAAERDRAERAERALRSDREAAERALADLRCDLEAARDRAIAERQAIEPQLGERARLLDEVRRANQSLRALLAVFGFPKELIPEDAAPEGAAASTDHEPKAESSRPY